MTRDFLLLENNNDGTANIYAEMQMENPYKFDLKNDSLEEPKNNEAKESKTNKKTV